MVQYCIGGQLTDYINTLFPSQPSFVRLSQKSFESCQFASIFPMMDLLLRVVVLVAIITLASGNIFGTQRSNKAGLQRRVTCPSVPDTTPLEQLCELSCGPGYTQCTDYFKCFNPGEGQVCCDDGSEFLARKRLMRILWRC